MRTREFPPAAFPLAEGMWVRLKRSHAGKDADGVWRRWPAGAAFVVGDKTDRRFPVCERAVTGIVTRLPGWKLEPAGGTRCTA